MRFSGKCWTHTETKPQTVIEIHWCRCKERVESRHCAHRHRQAHIRCSNTTPLPTKFFANYFVGSHVVVVKKTPWPPLPPPPPPSPPLATLPQIQLQPKALHDNCSTAKWCWNIRMSSKVRLFCRSFQLWHFSFRILKKMQKFNKYCLASFDWCIRFIYRVIYSIFACLFVIHMLDVA